MTKWSISLEYQRKREPRIQSEDIYFPTPPFTPRAAAEADFPAEVLARKSSARCGRWYHFSNATQRMLDVGCWMLMLLRGVGGTATETT